MIISLSTQKRAPHLFTLPGEGRHCSPLFLAEPPLTTAWPFPQGPLGARPRGMGRSFESQRHHFILPIGHGPHPVIGGRQGLLFQQRCQRSFLPACHLPLPGKEWVEGPVVELDPALPAGTATAHSFRGRRRALPGAAPVFPQLGVQNQHTLPIPRED